ncbi:MAG TPA: sulfatase [Verrucomicrobiota bacterium]|nr:sulfatase [Verrucomicrobiota bacterium]
MRYSLRSLFAVVLSVVAVTAMAKPNILFIAVDDLRPSIGCYGDTLAITPNIDRLAERGVRFGQAHCQVAVCNPSRASLMTGLRPDMLGVWTLPIHFREAKPKAVTLPQWLRRHGYTAVGHGKIYHNPTPDPQSWSEPIRPVQAERGYAEGWQARIREVQANLPDDDWRKNNLRGPSTAAPVIDDHKLVDGARTNLAIEDLRRLGQAKKPFFLALGFIRPHLAWISPRKYWNLYDPKMLPVITDDEVTPNTPPYSLSNSYELTHYMDLIDFPKPWDERRVSDTLARRLMHAYYASISYVDAQIGRLLMALDEEGLAENTIIVLWSDHGWKLGEHNGWGKMSNYEIDTRVPFIIVAPGLETAGQTTDTPVELLDVFPTLCDLAGIDTPDFVQGESLLPLLK